MDLWTKSITPPHETVPTQNDDPTTNQNRTKPTDAPPPTKTNTQAKMKSVEVPPEVLKKYCMDVSEVHFRHVYMLCVGINV